MHARVGDDLDFSMEQGFEVLTQTDEIEQRTSSLHVDKEVDVAAPVVLAAREPNQTGGRSGRRDRPQFEGSLAVGSAGPCNANVILS